MTFKAGDHIIFTTETRVSAYPVSGTIYPGHKGTVVVYHPFSALGATVLVKSFIASKGEFESYWPVTAIKLDPLYQTPVMRALTDAV